MPTCHVKPIRSLPIRGCKSSLPNRSLFYCLMAGHPVLRIADSSCLWLSLVVLCPDQKIRLRDVYAPSCGCSSASLAAVLASLRVKGGSTCANRKVRASRAACQTSRTLQRLRFMFISPWFRHTVTLCPRCCYLLSVIAQRTILNADVLKHNL